MGVEEWKIRPSGRSLLLWIYDDQMTSVADPKALEPDLLDRRNAVELLILRAHLQAGLADVERLLGEQEGGWLWSPKSSGDC